MKIPYRWIREFVDLDLSAEEAADRLINAGIEVASVTRLAPPDLQGVVVGEIEAIEREVGESHGHRLVMCRVSTGRQRFAVLCGAPNVRARTRAAFAPPGATLPGGEGKAPRRITVATIRGTESQGMLCSERELGIGDAHETGIVVLEEDAPLGADLLDHLGLDDSVLEIEITPNRPDCLSVVGVARELAALTGASFRPLQLAVKESDEAVSALARVSVEAPDLCWRYTVRVINDVRIGASPAWMATRLRAAGLRPISNVVDITNYVMWELGQPLHAFDAAAVTDDHIVVRRGHDGEHITTLDGQDRALTSSTLLIADRRRAIGIAGVMGGANTEVTPSTARVLLESAYFLPGSIRRTARRLGLASDAAYRFERGADIEGLVDANDRAAQLMADLAGGKVARGMIDVYPAPRPRPRVSLRMSRVRRVLGVSPTREHSAGILRRLGLEVTERGPEMLEAEVPTFRRDLTMEDDLVEEIIRVWGYDKIPSTLPGGAISLVQAPASRRQAAAARRALVEAGLDEVVSYSFTDTAHASAWVGPPPLAPPELRRGTAAPLALANPLSQDAALLRQHPLEGVLRAIATNLRRQGASVRVFEISRTYDRQGATAIEPRWAAIALTGARTAPSWYEHPGAVDVYDAKGLAAHVLHALGIVNPRDAAATDTAGSYEPDARGALTAGDADAPVMAEYGEVAASVRERFDIEAPVFAAVISLDAVAARPLPPTRYQPLPRFPSVQRDLAFVMPAGDEPKAGEVEAAIAGEAGPLLRQITLFDLFQLPDGRRSLAWRLTFQADDRTLTDEQINDVNERVAARVSQRFGITRRGA